MTRQIKQRAAALILVCMMVFLIPGQLMTVFGANARIAFSDPTGSVGSQITVKMKITSSDKLANANVMLAYDSNVLEFVSGTNAEGGAGAIRVRGDAGTPNTGSLSYNLTFNALAAGTSKITVTSQEIYDSNSQIVTVDKQGDSTVTIGALQTASQDATLKSLQISPGTLTPEFSPEVDTYGVTVGTDVEKLIVNAETNDSGATHVIEGGDNLQMGENRVSLKVTAANGEASKEYIIVVTKAEGGASADPGTAGTSFKMHVSKRTFTVLEPDETVTVPEGFKETTIKIDGNEVKGWVWGAAAEHQYCVIYGMNEAGEKGLYRYDIKDTERTLQRYFEDPTAAEGVTSDAYDQLAVKYEKLQGDFGLFKKLLIAAVVISVILLILLLVAVLGKDSSKGGTPRTGSSRKRGKGEQEPENRKLSEGGSEEEEPEEEEASYEEDGFEDSFEDEEILEGPYAEEPYAEEPEDGYPEESYMEEMDSEEDLEGLEEEDMDVFPEPEFFVDEEAAASYIEPVVPLKPSRETGSGVRPEKQAEVQVREAQPERQARPGTGEAGQVQPPKTGARQAHPAQPSRGAAYESRTAQRSQDPVRPSRQVQPSQAASRSSRDQQSSQTPVRPGRDQQPSRTASRLSRDQQSSQTPVRPGRDQQLSQTPVRPGRDQQLSQAQIRPGRDQQPSQGQARPGRDQQPPQTPVRPGWEQQPSQRPVRQNSGRPSQAQQRPADQVQRPSGPSGQNTGRQQPGPSASARPAQRPPVNQAASQRRSADPSQRRTGSQPQRTMPSAGAAGQSYARRQPPNDPGVRNQRPDQRMVKNPPASDGDDFEIFDL